MTAVRCSEHTAVSLSLGTGDECRVSKPLNLSHLSDEHLEGLLSAVHAEWKSRNLSDLHEVFQQEEIPAGSLLNIGLEQ